VKIVITDEAYADIERIGDYIARDNPRRAISFVQELVEHCLGLAGPTRLPRFHGTNMPEFVAGLMATI
jgi:plasmid stabilization system protein ParE